METSCCNRPSQLPSVGTGGVKFSGKLYERKKAWGEPTRLTRGPGRFTLQRCRQVRTVTVMEETGVS